MKRIDTTKDYSEFLIRVKMIVRNIEKSMNDGDSDVAKFMSLELGVTAQMLYDSIVREEAKK
jgi:hypothetical protein